MLFGADHSAHDFLAKAHGVQSAKRVILILIHLRIGESSAIPLISEPRRIHGVLAEKHAFVHLSGRERRGIQCQVGHYLHPNGTHCCIKCHKGTYLSEHCSGPDKAPRCSVCPEGAYMPTENYSQKCFACQPCRTSFQQIIKISCTKSENTVCGCDNNQYKTTRNAEFLCKNCSDCHNGKIRQDCTSDSDTICECDIGFFLKEDQNKCLPCSSCDKEDCKERCKTEMVIKNSSNSTELISVLSFLTVIFAVGFVALTFKAIKKYFPERQYFSSCTSGQQSKKQLASKTADKTKNTLLDIKEEMISGTMQVLPLSQAQCQELPDCIKSARETRISDSPVVLYAVMDAVPVLRWKEFMRYLGLSENTIDRIFLDHQHRRDAQYETLKEWRLLANHDATMERISQVLSKMDLSGCIEDIQEALAKQ
ncbi:tumor necrosis factor receptor superfamily member 1A-like isoform X2 [Ahaetulla prasina]|uniref:tumor necrosis factor receptor superfamily member 1A-like isoform X2 n=1 Tax=Ahaetulla prasina TaxID=499056 RepID=UPI002647ECB3|nr:tumor necrosis factor receptor superfamily member 1A-like isoform X2 [Ahaetulla prasina]